MKLNKIGLSLFIFLASFNSYSINFNYDVLDNPKYYEMPADIRGEVKERSLNEMRNATISSMENRVFEECNLASDIMGYMYDVRMQEHSGAISKSNANEQVFELISQAPYRWISFYDFPMGFGIYRTFDQIIKLAIQNGVDRYHAVDRVLTACKRQINFSKYLLLLSDNDLTPKNIKLPSLSGLKDKTENSLLPLLTNTAPNNSKYISKDRIKLLDMKPENYFVAITLISDDIKSNLKSQNRDNWLLYGLLLSRKLDDFFNYTQNGGKNDDYYELLFLSKLIPLDYGVYQKLVFYPDSVIKVEPLDIINKLNSTDDGKEKLKKLLEFFKDDLKVK